MCSFERNHPIPLYFGEVFFFTRGKEKNKSLRKEAVNKELQLTKGHEGNKQEADLEPNRRACVMLGVARRCLTKTE